MKYNPFGYRFFSGKSNKDGDVFIYSSQGQLIGKYKISGNMLKLDFMPIYEGTKRIGIVERENVTWFDCPNFVGCPTDDIGVDAWRVAGLSIKESFLKADRKYELVDHLGNVRVVIANQRMPVDTNGDSLVDYYKPLVKEISDYYPYGWQKILGRYEFGANAGSLFEDWDSTRGTYYTLYRLLDARIARWYQVEPKWEQYAWLSGYVVNGSNPILYIDPLGDTIKGDENAMSVYYELKSWVQKEIERYNRKIQRVEEKIKKAMDKGKQKRVYRLQKKRSALVNMRNIWQGIADELAILESSEQVYYLVDRGEDGGVLSFDSTTGYVLVKFDLDDPQSVALLAHELKHAYQFETGKLSLIVAGAGGRLYDIMDEVEAYKRSQLFGLYEDVIVTPMWVRNLSKNYKNLPDKQLTINTLDDDGNTMGYNIAEVLWEVGKRGYRLSLCKYCEVIKGWKKYYMQGLNNMPFKYP